MNTNIELRVLLKVERILQILCHAVSLFIDKETNSGLFQGALSTFVWKMWRKYGKHVMIAGYCRN